MRNYLNPFIAHSPRKGAKELIEHTNITHDDTLDKKILSAIKVRPFGSPKASAGEDEFGHEFIEDRRAYWREYLNEQRSKVRHSLGTFDKKAWAVLDSDLKVNL
jgi:hypothetical protein